MVKMLSTNVWARDTPDVCLHEYCIDTDCRTESMHQLFIIFILSLAKFQTCNDQMFILTCEWTMFNQISSNLVFIHRYNAEVLHLSYNFGLVKLADAITPSVRVIMVNLTVGNRSGLTGNRSNRSGPVPVPTGSQPVQIQILNLNSKK